MSTMQRSAWQVLQDAIVKQRVLNGIALLEKEHGPDWASKVDLNSLELSSATHCVLGQLYGTSWSEWDSELTDDDVVKWATSERGLLSVEVGETPSEFTERARQYLAETDGYTRGIAVIDGPLLKTDGPGDHGFENSGVYLYELEQASDERLAKMGVTRAMVDAAKEETAHGLYSSMEVSGGYTTLNETWHDVIEKRQQ